MFKQLSFYVSSSGIWKALERHVDMTEVDWFTGIDLFVSPQPGFKMVNSCINQLF